MARCFACDLLSEALQYDRPTDRFYCNECFAATTEVMLSLIDYEESDYDFLKVVEIETDTIYSEDITRDEEEDSPPWD